MILCLFDPDYDYGIVPEYWEFLPDWEDDDESQ